MSPPALVNQRLQLRNFLLGQFLSGGESSQKRREGAGEGLLHELLALHGIKILSGHQGGHDTALVLEDTPFA